MLTQIVKSASLALPAFEYVGKVFTTSPSSPSNTFSSVDLGADAAKRLVILVNATGGGVATVTVAGQSTTKIAEETTGSPYSAVFTLSSVTAASGDIVVTRSVSITALTVFVYAVYGVGLLSVGSSDATSPFTFTTDFDNKEVFIGLGRYLSSTTATFTNATTDDTSVLTGFTAAQVASYISPNNSSRTITFTPVNTTSAWLVSAVIS